MTTFFSDLAAIQRGTAPRIDPAVYPDHAHLMAELLSALEAGEPDRMVRTPGFADHAHPGSKRSRLTAAEVVADDVAGSNDPLPEMLRLLAKAGRSADPELRLGVQALWAGIARRHADYHAGSDE